MPTTTPTRALRVAATLVSAQALALLALAVWVAVTPLARDVADRGLTEVEAAFTLVAALLVGAVARGLWRGSGWALSPALVVQFFVVVVGVYQLEAAPLLAVPLLVVGLATGVSLVAAREALTR